MLQSRGGAAFATLALEDEDGGAAGSCCGDLAVVDGEEGGSGGRVWSDAEVRRHRRRRCEDRGLGSRL